MRHRRRKHTFQGENLDRWLVSYADFITLLFAFFTTMYAISNVDAQKMGRMVLSMQAAFDASVFPAANSRIGLTNSGALPIPQNSQLYNTFINLRGLSDKQHSSLLVRQTTTAGENLGRVQQDLSGIVMDDALKDKVKVTLRNRGVVVSLAEAGFFDSGSDTVRSTSLPLLDRIATYIAGLPNFIRVEGHTDNVPISTPRFPSNWELSTARATFIISYLVNRHGFSPDRLSAAGYGEFHPVDTNATPEGRAKNRRVDVVILGSAAMRQEPGADALPPSAPGR